MTYFRVIRVFRSFNHVRVVSGDGGEEGKILFGPIIRFSTVGRLQTIARFFSQFLSRSVSR